MKKLLILLTIILTGASSYATHIISSEITYTYVTGNDYEVSLILYRDCAGAPAGSYQTVNFGSLTCSQSFTSNLSLLQTTDVSQVCAGQTTTCNGGAVSGIEQDIYRGIVTLTPCSDWTISWNSCCRNPSTSNLNNPGSQSIYIQNTLNNIIGVNNNSPQYYNLPNPHLSVNNLTFYNHGTSDADGDSLYYSLATPLTTPGPPGSPIAFAAGYSQGQPVITSTGFNFNQLTGEMCFIPSQLQTSTVSTLIEEFRNGALIASQIREMQVTVANYSNQAPNTGVTPVCGGTGTLTITASGVSVSQIDGNSISMCPNDSVCFEISPTDPDGDSITISSNILTAMPGASFTVVGNNTASPVATICWVPTGLDQGLNEFYITLTDDLCPNPAERTYSYDIDVMSQVSIHQNISICPGDSVLIYGTYQSTAGTYTEILPSASGCDTILSTTLSFPNFSPSFTFTDIGLGNYSFTNTSTGPYTLSDWSFGNGVTSSVTNPTHSFSVDGTYTVVLAIADSSALTSNSCIEYYIDTIVVTSSTNSLQCNAGFVVYPDPLTADLLIINNSTGINLTYSWDFGDGFTSPLQNPTHTYAGPGPYSLCLTIDDGNGCTSTFCDSVSTNGVVFKNGGFTINVTSTSTSTGIEEDVSPVNFSLMPNPSNGNFSINRLDDLEKEVTIKIVDLLSKVIVEERIPKGKEKIDINIEEYKKGMYFVQFITGNKITVKRIIKH